jgi:hypothetical protein
MYLPTQSNGSPSAEAIKESASRLDLRSWGCWPAIQLPNGQVMKMRSIWRPAGAFFFLCVASHAYCQEKQNLAPATKPAHVRRALAAASTDPKADAAPCPRGTWKDDPVCFGEGASDTLPTPSASSATPSNAPSNGPTIKPTANINPRPGGPGPYQAGVIYQSNGNAVASSYGGGIKMELPF